MSENLFDAEAPDLQMCITELKRELLVRRNVYPGWVKKGRLTSTLAEHRMACIKKSIELLEEGQ